MNTPANIWAPHLGPDERIVWSASISVKLVRADLLRQRSVALVVLMAALIVAALLALVFVNSITPQDIVNVGAFLAPIYLAFAIAIGILAMSQVWKLIRPHYPAATDYAATNTRLLALKPDGAVASEMPAAEIGEVIVGGHRPDLVVMRRDEDSEAAAFPIRFIDRPLEAKAIIEETFLEPSPEETAQ